jgi:hypothetical protein
MRAAQASTSASTIDANLFFERLLRDSRAVGAVNPAAAMPALP